LSKEYNKGDPVTIVHFDGHGSYEDMRLRFSEIDEKKCNGYIWFEAPNIRSNQMPIDGKMFGATLSKFGVKTLILNACWSAFRGPYLMDSNKFNSTSFAQDAINAGLVNVLAMSYTLHKTTAIDFFREFYRYYFDNFNILDSVCQGRKYLQSNKYRSFQKRKYKFIDWMIPILYCKNFDLIE
jgi:hypothetical protein